MNKKNFDSQEIVVLTKNLNHLVENCLHNFDSWQMEVVQRRMKNLIKQSHFWLKQDNPQRFTYDLRDFSTWLCDFIGDVEREFWGETEEK